MGGPEQLHVPSLRDFAAVFFRHRRLFLVSFVLVLVTGTFYAALFTSYTAEMKVVVRRGRFDPAVSPAQTTGPLLQSETVSEEELNSEVELLQDEDLLRETVAKTGLAETWSWLSYLRRENPDARIEHEVRRLAKEIEVQPVRKSQVITVTYRSRDPKLAASVLQALAGTYLARHTRVQRPAGQQVFFDDQVRIAKGELEKAQRQLERFTSRSAAASLERDLTLQKLSDAKAAEFGLQAALAEAAGRAQALDTKLHELPPRRVSQIRNTDNPQLQEKLKSKLLELELHRTELLSNFQPSYRLAQEVDQEIAQTKTTLEAENLTPLRDELTEDNPDYLWANSERIKTGVELDGLHRRAHATGEQVAAYSSRAQSLARSAIQQNDLEERLKAAEDKYLLYLGKREEARLGDALDQTGILNAAIMQAPRVPALPSVPLWLAFCLSLAAACALSTGAVFVADYFDPSLRSPREITALLGMPVLASFSPPPAGYSQKLRAI